MAKNAPLLSDLREPPVVGRFYMVPIVTFPWHDRVRDWPVLGPLHSDAEFFAFPDIHYHIDVRFVGARDHRYMARHMPIGYDAGSVDANAATVATGWPLNRRDKDLPKGRPPLKRLRCKRAATPTLFLDLTEKAQAVEAEMAARYGSPAAPIRRRDGRLLCPHRKVDLSTFRPDAEGVVVCPLHGLRVRCAEAAHG